ncbi:hypothetical protein [Streptomyces sp. S1]|uniref:hypothetical protein n=1 Tax=Streptomyces sp. S1 TaxID=718288 RepID=UPI003D755CD7
MDHIPPLFGDHKGFTQAVSQHSFASKADKNHAIHLADRKSIGDDTLHRQIGSSGPAITMHDLPTPIRLRSVLHEVARILRKADRS